MAGSTTNLGLIKPLGSEKIRIAQINQNSDTLDAAIGAVGSTSLQAQVSAIEDGIAIVANGDSHVAITAGQFVYVRNNTHNLAEGLYVASANVSANASITSSNMTADASGGLNALNANITNKFGTNYGGTSNPITSLDDLPINGAGYATLAASISPTGALGAFSFIKSGAITGNRYNVLVKRIYSGISDQIYFGAVYDGTLLGWQQLALNGNSERVVLDAGASGVTTSSGYLIRDNANKTVRVYGYARSDSNITASMSFAGIPSGYRPTSNYSGFCTLTLANGGTVAAPCIFGTDGTIKQNMSSSVREITFFGEYPLA